MARIAEKVPSWVERLLIPTLESRVREIVREEVGHLEKVIEARFEAASERIASLEKNIEARFEAVNVKIDSLEKRIPVVQELAEIKVRLAEVEKRIASR